MPKVEKKFIFVDDSGDPGFKGGIKIKYEDSCKAQLIQIADAAAGAANRLLQGDKNDSGIYFKIIKGKVVTFENIGNRYLE